MMNRKILVGLCVVVVLLSSGCEKLPVEGLPECLDQFGAFEPENKPDDGTVTFDFYENASLNVLEQDDWVSFEQEEGDHLVFDYTYSFNDNPMIADDEYSERILFEVDGDEDSFLISGVKLQSAEALFGRMCFCVDGGFHRVKDGCIYGEKQKNGDWQVAMALQIETRGGTYTRMIHSEFTFKDN